MLHRMGLIRLYATVTSPKPVKSTSSSHISPDWQDDSMSFCDCNKENEKCCQHSSKSHFLSDTCRCGEEASDVIDWIWDSSQIQPQTIVKGPNVSFHPFYSQGTSIVRGEIELEKGMIHYWEIKIVNWSPGTDLVSFNLILILCYHCSNSFILFGVFFLDVRHRNRFSRFI